MEFPFTVEEVPSTASHPAGELKCYLVISTAETTVGPKPVSGPDPAAAVNREKAAGREAEAVTAKSRVKEIATILKDMEEPEVVLMIHGYNNPRSIAENTLKRLFRKADEDERMTAPVRSNRVLIGYIWPSEGLQLGALVGTPRVVLGTLFFGLLFTTIFYLLVRGYNAFVWLPFVLLLPALISVLMLAIGLTLPIMRGSIYWRDTYRATQYGIPDLVAFFQELDKALCEVEFKGRAKISFIGHSMGTYVVTSAVRILTDVFSPNSDEKAGDKNLGTSMELARLVLVSPDIPAEALMPRRSNFLQSALRRFDDAFLVSNEGDIVLWTIANLANSISFPALNSDAGYRLGNIGLRAYNDGKTIFGNFRLGHKSVEEIGSPIPEKDGRPYLAERFTYVDATDFMDKDGKRWLSSGRPKRGSYNWLQQTVHLFGYIACLVSHGKQGWDVHSGYFGDQELSSEIVHLASTGWEGSNLSNSDFTKAHQIHVRRGEPLIPAKSEFPVSDTPSSSPPNVPILETVG